jgi:ubiquinone/menaquinone biosynthesis C-methylase UbiE
MASDVIRTGRVTRQRSEGIFGAIQAGARILDVGAGNSPFVGELIAGGHGAVAVDSDYALRLPRHSDSVAGDAAALPFLASSFDEVHSSYALMHLEDRAEAVSEILRVIRPEGRVCITPVWPSRAPHGLWAQCPEARLIRGSLYPRRRASLELHPTSSHRALTELVTRISGPSEPVQWLGRVAMSAIVTSIGTSEFEVSRFRLRRVPERAR